MPTTRIKHTGRKLAGTLALLLALGALGLVACGGGDDETTAVSETKTAGDELAVDNKKPNATAVGDRTGARARASCGKWDRYMLEVEGDISCPAARGVFHGYVEGRLQGSWICAGSDAMQSCTKEPGIVITARWERALQ
jgi:hypothetical protein